MSDIYNKFPPERKNEFLRWVMITQPKDMWYRVVLDYIEHHHVKYWYKGMEFVIKHCDDPCWMACYLAMEGYATAEWARNIIEDNVYQPVGIYIAVYTMEKHGLATPEWANKIKMKWANKIKMKKHIWFN